MAKAKTIVPEEILKPVKKHVQLTQVVTSTQPEIVGAKESGLALVDKAFDELENISHAKAVLKEHDNNHATVELFLEGYFDEEKAQDWLDAVN